jgi:hypothetical protein
MRLLMFGKFRSRRQVSRPLPRSSCCRPDRCPGSYETPRSHPLRHLAGRLALPLASRKTSLHRTSRRSVQALALAEIAVTIRVLSSPLFLSDFFSEQNAPALIDFSNRGRMAV